jgi:hypothetical protein
MLTKRATEKPKDVLKFFLVCARGARVSAVLLICSLQTHNKDQDGNKEDKLEFTVIP